MAHGLERIRWEAPWLVPYRATGEACALRVIAGDSVSRALQAAAVGVSFVPQTALPAGQAYETFIFETRQVPTRDGLHDFFNGLVWRQFPQSKRRLNQLQAAEIAAQGIRLQRGPVRDAVTLFDESGLLLQAPDEIWAALCARDWPRLFLELRPLWNQVRVTLFGHALMEQLVTPRKNLTARVLRLPQIWSADALDTELALWLDAPRLACKPFQPLPVLGIPGWWPDNEVPGFYEDANVFRPLRATT